MSNYVKDPAAVLPAEFDWSAWLGGDTITGTPVVTATPEDALTVGDPTHADGVVTAWVSGGEAGTDVRLTCRVVTAGGRTDERSMRISLRDR